MWKMKLTLFGNFPAVPAEPRRCTLVLTCLCPFSDLIHSTFASSLHEEAEFESSFCGLNFEFISFFLRPGYIYIWWNRMGKSFDDLLSFLLEEIALCGNQGTFLIAPARKR